MGKLNQVVAVVNGKKSQAKKVLTGLYQTLQKEPLFQGLVRTYVPVDDDGDTLPPEKTLVRTNVKDVVGEAINTWMDLIDTVATQDMANSNAKADIVVDGVVLAREVPVTHLMFLEKQLIDMHTFVSALPTLDETSEWNFDDNRGCFASTPEVKNRDLKFTQHKVVYEATANHPAQIAEVSITKKAGEFTTVKLSGAIPVSTKRQLVDKVVKLQDAVKFAREEANMLDVQQIKLAEGLLKYVFE